jgi:transcription elongation factor GreB
MSRAFVRENDMEQLPELPVPAAALPPGAKNYVTPGGAERLRQELAHLLDDRRPPLAAAAPDDLDAKRELQSVDRRIRYLQSGLRAAEVVGADAGPTDIVRFGATVTVREPKGGDATYRIVGVDETDASRDWISWVSPLARALMNARVGDKVTFRAPRGAQELEIRSIRYE